MHHLPSVVLVAVCAVALPVAAVARTGGPPSEQSDEPTGSARVSGGVAGGGAFAANGKIVFVSSRGPEGVSHIYSVNPDGSGETQLTSGDDEDSSPLPSPNGKLIAFSSKRTYAAKDAFNWDLWVMRADGAALKRLTTRGRLAGRAAWSRDSKRITYSFGVKRVSTWAINADGSGRKFVTRGYLPASSPDGTKVVGERNGRIWISNAKTRALLTKNGVAGEGATWSPDSKRLAYVLYNNGSKSATYEIWVMNGDGTKQVRLTKNNYDDSQPSWAPDSSMLAFSSSPGLDGTSHIFVMRPTGSGVKKLTDASAEYAPGDYQPAWSSRP